VSDYFNDTVTTYNGVTGAQEALTISGLTTPLGIAVDKQGRVYVAQTGGVGVFNADGSPDMTITTGVNAPTTVSVDKKGNIYISNCPSGGGGYVSTYLSNGTQTTPTITGLTCPTAVAIDAQGTIYVADLSSGGTSGDMTTYNASGVKQSLTITESAGLPWGLAVK